MVVVFIFYELGDMVLVFFREVMMSVGEEWF